MHYTKLTKKGQITIPKEYRSKMEISTGSVVEIEFSDKNLVIKKPRKDLDDLFGAWKGLSDAELKEMRKAWGRWNAKAIGKL